MTDKIYKNKCWLDPEFVKSATENMRAAWSKERREEMSKTLKQRYIDRPELRQALSDRFAGVPKSEAHKEKMAQAKLGVPKSEAHRESMRKAHATRYAILAQLKDTGLTHREAVKFLKENKESLYNKFEENKSIHPL